jgi:hypothetical protein
MLGYVFYFFSGNGGRCRLAPEDRRSNAFLMNLHVLVSIASGIAYLCNIRVHAMTQMLVPLLLDSQSDGTSAGVEPLWKTTQMEVPLLLDSESEGTSS